MPSPVVAFGGAVVAGAELVRGAAVFALIFGGGGAGSVLSVVGLGALLAIGAIEGSLDGSAAAIVGAGA
ncbi:MAG: hypothetical protein HUU21_26770, partial [Polyangiaceae bacterium]|nr:hypothetical protein [Polyangiaceae bacterium]